MTASANSVLMSLAQLSPDSDKATVLDTIDAAVDDLLSQLRVSESGALAKEFLTQTQQTVVFLEACTGFPDPTFTQHTRKRMIELQGALVEATQPGVEAEVAVPANDEVQPESEPEPGESQEQTSDEADPAMSAEAAAPAETRSFEEVFTDSLCKFVCDRLAIFHVPTPPQELLDLHDGQVPYPLSSEFTDNLTRMIREHFMGPILESRNIKILAGGVGPQDLNETYFMGVFSQPKRENVVRTLWTAQLDIVKAALRDQQPAADDKAQAKSKRGKQKTSFVGRMFGKKDKGRRRPSAKSAVGGDTARGMAAWKTLTQDGKASYDPPEPEEIGLLDALFDYKLPAINKRKVAVEQLLRQEVGESEGREGSSRVYLSKMVLEMPPHCGELVSLWAYYEHILYFTPDILKSYLASQATSEHGRRSALPLFLRWVPDPLSKIEEEE